MSARRRFTLPGWFPRLTRRGGMFLAVGGALLLNAIILDRRDLMFIAFLLVAVPVTALAYVTVRPVRVALGRAIRPVIVPAGSEAVVALRLRNLSSRPISGTRWRDTASPGITVPGSALMPPLERYLGGPETGADTVRLEYTLTPLRRGVYDLGPLMFGRMDPFALAVSERPVGEPHDLVVTPRITPLPGSALSIHSGDGSIHQLIRHISPNADELIAREYRPGDALRRVNWPATARHGELMVRQEEQRSNPAARIILDTTLSGRPAYTPTLTGARTSRHGQAFELAVELTACIGVHLLDEGFRLELMELGPSQLAPGAEGGRGGLLGDAPGSFRAPGGDRLLLEGLGNIVTVPRADPDVTRTSGPGAGSMVGTLPTFAVLVDIDGQDAHALAAIRGRCAPAVAFVVDTMSKSALERLQGAGWHCIGLRTPKDIPSAWDQAQQREGGAVRGRV